MPQNYKFCNQTGETPYYHGNSYTITQNSDTITETPDFCLIVRFLPQSPSYQRHPKNQKLGPTTHRDEPHQTSKSLDFKPFFNTFACEYPNSYGIISELPPVPPPISQSVLGTVNRKHTLIQPYGRTLRTTGRRHVRHKCRA